LLGVGAIDPVIHAAIDQLKFWLPAHRKPAITASANLKFSLRRTMGLEG
jgi:hypothetical protein